MYHRNQIKRLTGATLTATALLCGGSLWADPVLVQSIPDQNVSHTQPDINITLSPTYFTFTTGSPITYSVTNDNPAVVGAVEAGGVLTLSFTPGVVGTAGIRVFAHQDGVDRDTQFDVDASNSVPAVVGPAAIPPFDEDQSVYLGNSEFAFSDPDGAADDLTFSLGAPSGPTIWNAVLLDPDTGELDFIHVPNANGTQTFRVIATDMLGQSAIWTFTLTANPIPDPPVVTTGVANQVMVEDEPTRSVNVVGGFDDPDLAWEGDNLTVISAVSSNPGLVAAVPNVGDVELTPGADLSGGPVTITVTIEDSTGNTANTNFTVDVTPDNDPVTVAAGIPDQPVAEDTATVNVDLTGAFADVDLANEGDSHTVTVVSNSNPALLSATNSPINVLDGTLSFAVVANGNGTANITVEAADVGGTSTTTSFDIIVSPSNDPPVLVGNIADQAMTEDEATRTVEAVAEFDDPDLAWEGDTLTVLSAVSSNPGLVTAAPNGTGVDITPVADQSGGPATITVTVEDTSGATAVETFTVTVGTVNDPVVAVGVIGDRLVNEDPPVINVNLAGIFEDADLLGAGDTHTVTVIGNTNPGMVTPTNSPLATLTGTLNFAVTANIVGTTMITLRAQDAAGTTADVSFNIDVAPVNDPPFVVTAVPDQISTEDTPSLAVSFAGTFDDVDLTTEGDIQAYSYSLDNGTLVTSASISGTTITLDFAPDQNGIVNVTLTVTDKAALTASDTFAVSVAAVNDNPFVENPVGVIGVNEDAPPTVINLNGVFNDVDIATNGDVLSYTLTANSDPSLFSNVDLTGNTLTLTYAGNMFGSSTLSVQARDLAGATVTDTFTVNITEIFPTAFNDSASMLEDGGTLTIDVLGNDDLGEPPTTITLVGRNWPDATTGPYFDVSNSDPTTIIDEAGSSVTRPNGTLAVVGGMVEYTPKANYNGADWFEYVITDRDGDTSMGVVNITVTPQPDAPRPFANPEYTVDQGSFLDIQAAGGIASFAVDDDGDPMEVRLISVPTHHISFTLDPSGDGSFTYTPDPAYGGNPGDTDSFQIYYWDENDGLASAPVTVTINFDPDEGIVMGPPPGEVEFDFDLADVPLEDAISAEANVLIMMDDSGSMDWSVMTPEDGGEFLITNSGVKNNGVQTQTTTYRYVHQLTTNIYGGNLNVPTEEALAADAVFNGNNYGVWRARNSNYSPIYYNPRIRYIPWTGLDRNGVEFTDVDPTAAPMDPFDATVRLVNLTALHSFRSDDVPGISVRRRDVNNNNVYFPYYYDTTATGVPAWDAPHAKVTINGTFPVTLADGTTLGYYPGGPARADCATDDMDPLTCTFAQELQNYANWFSYYRSREYSAKAALGRAVASASNLRMGYAVLNDANEREPIDSLNASFRVGHKKELMDQIYKINSNGSTPLRRALDRAGRHFECRSGDAFGSTANTAPGNANCPVLPSPEGQCQNNFTLLFSDGTWNGAFAGLNHDRSGGVDPSPSPFDGGMFQDNYSASLADVAMYYYERDLHPSLLNGVPTTQRDQDWAPAGALSADGETMHQHMKTYTVGFGLVGTVRLTDLPPLYTTPFAWPDPFDQGLAKIDDMLHAAVNSRGQFLQANNPVLLSQAFADAFEAFSDGSVSVSAVAFNSTALREETIEYRGFFNLKFNSGDLRALSVNSTTGVVDNANPIWRAAVQMDSINPTTRKIVTWNDVSQTAIPFVHGSLNADQQATMDLNEVNWVRGVRTQEEPNGILRARETDEGMLGDIVHSAPVFVGSPRAFRRDQAPYPTGDLYSNFANSVSDRDRVVYVAANDGMLHAFDAGTTTTGDFGTGDELFAYIPNKILDSSERFSNKLDQLTSLVYSHRYFVDLTPTVEDVYVRATRGSAIKSWNTVLVGGLGGGGKGYFALNVSDPDNSYSSLANAMSTVMWEFTDEDDFYPVDDLGDPLVDGGGNPLLDLGGDPVKDLGYAYSQAQIVLTNVQDGGGENEWMAVFGNGYNSSAGIAKLFLLNINGGMDGWDVADVIKLNTNEGVKNAPDPDAGLPNGLGTPAMVDRDGNGTADLAYAGDLFGNLFRFDISDADPANWTTTKLFQATYDGTQATRQAITTQPFVRRHPDGGFLVVFATGSYITEQDGTSTDIESLYGIWDRGEVSPATAPASAKFDRLVEQTVTNLVDEAAAAFDRLRITSANSVTYLPDAGPTPGVYGWYIDLDMPRATDTLQGNPNTDTSGNAPPAAQYPGERAIRRFISRGDALLITTVIPRDSNTCFRSPPGATWPIDALTGGNPRRAILDTNNDGVVDDDDLISYNGEYYAAGILFDTDDLDGTLVDPSLLIGRGNEDFLFLSGGDDQITLRIAGPADPKTGRLSWRELEEAN
ncbi:MAG: PilC/PilY family type IV pilus protein [Pseudomonadales bacterium]